MDSMQCGLDLETSRVRVGPPSWKYSADLPAEGLSYFLTLQIRYKAWFSAHNLGIHKWNSKNDAIHWYTLSRHHFIDSPIFWSTCFVSFNMILLSFFHKWSTYLISLHAWILATCSFPHPRVFLSIRLSVCLSVSLLYRFCKRALLEFVTFGMLQTLSSRQDLHL